MGKCVVQELIALLVIPPLVEGDPFLPRMGGWGSALHGNTRAPANQ